MDTGDLLNNLTGRMQVNQPLMNPHLISIPSLRTLTVGGLPGGDFKDLGGQSDGALDFEILVLGSCDQIRADYQLATAHEELVLGRRRQDAGVSIGTIPFSTFLT